MSFHFEVESKTNFRTSGPGSTGPDSSIDFDFGQDSTGGGGWGQGVLPYFSYRGMCRLIGYQWSVLKSEGILFGIGYLNHRHCQKLSDTKTRFTLELYA